MLNIFSPEGDKTFSVGSLPLCYLQTIHVADRSPITIVWDDFTTQGAWNDMYYYDITENYMAELAFQLMSGWSVDENTFPETWNVWQYVTPCYFLRGYMIVNVTPSPTPHVVFPVCYNFFGNVTCTSIFNSTTGMYDKIIVDIYTKNMTMDYLHPGGYISGPFWRTFNPKGSMALYVYASGVAAKSTDNIRVFKDTGTLSLSDSARTTKVLSPFNIRWGEDGGTVLGSSSYGSFNTSIYGGSLKSYSIPIPGDGSKRPVVLPIAQKKFGAKPTPASEYFNYFIIPDSPLEVMMVERASGVYWGVFETAANNGNYSDLRIIGAESMSFSYVRRWSQRFDWEAFYSIDNETNGGIVDSTVMGTDLAKAFILST